MSNQNSLAVKPVLPADKTDDSSADWQSVLADAVRDPGELRRLAGIAADIETDAIGPDGQPPADTSFGTLAPRTFLARIRPGDPCDPLLLQVMPSPAENLRREGFGIDPLGEADGASHCLLQKYPGRSLILTTAACGVHCRYCFRRHLPHRDGNAKRSLLERLHRAIQRIEADRSIHEVILSGGDPLTIEDRQLALLVGRLAEIRHLRRLRVHTRLPIVIPQRVTSSLVEVLKSSRLTATVVIQSNHPLELCDTVETALGRLIDAGIPVLCQSVLLAGVNDGIEVLAELCERLIDCRVMPYYLHQLDRVAGAAHLKCHTIAGCN